MIKKKGFQLLLIVLAGAVARTYFCIGPIFSDDAYYNYLAYTLLQGNFGHDYLGYTTCPLRINLIAVTAFSFWLFGSNEFATMVFPMVISLANIGLAFVTAREITTSERIGLLAAFLMAIFPTDIAFAMMNFTDAPSAFFINLGVLFLWRAHERQSMKYSLLSGLSFFISIQFKMNAIYVALLSAILLIYILVKFGRVDRFALVPILVIAGNFVMEGLVYLAIYQDFFYRIHQMALNYSFAENFYLVRGRALPENYKTEMIKRALLLNPRSIFLRRFYLFLPSLALIQGFLSYRKRESRLLIYWFLGLCLIYVGFTASFERYQPMNLHFSWYPYPVFMPAIILASMFLIRLAPKIRTLILLALVAGSFIMCKEYQSNLGKGPIDELRALLNSNRNTTVFTDHHTQYSIDLLDGYEPQQRTRRILGRDFDWNSVQKGDLVVEHPGHILEQRLLQHEFPDFGVLKTEAFKVELQNAYVKVYRRVL